MERSFARTTAPEDQNERVIVLSSHIEAKRGDHAGEKWGIRSFEEICTCVRLQCNISPKGRRR